MRTKEPRDHDSICSSFTSYLLPDLSPLGHASVHAVLHAPTAAMDPYRPLSISSADFGRGPPIITDRHHPRAAIVSH